MARRFLFAAALFAVASPGAAPAQSPLTDAARRYAGKLTPCALPGDGEEALCGHLDVYEDRSTNTGRKIPLNIVLLPATTDSVRSDPLVFLAGGGVVPATRYARLFAHEMPLLRRTRDILLVDQRGSGGSNGLVCDRRPTSAMATLEPEERFLAVIGRCRETLADRADLRFYTTALAMDDLDDVREWLGAPMLNLFGVSYGTSAAQTYIRQHPTRVRTVVMHGVVPLDAPMQVDLARSAQRSLDRLLALCRDDARCHATFSDLDAEAKQVLASGSSPANRMTREAINELLASAATMREIPRIIHELAAGDTSVLERAQPPSAAAGAGPAAPAGPPLGVRLAILCSEGLRRIDTASIRTQTAGTFLGDSPVRFQLRWCDGWPLAELPPTFWTAVRSEVPALLLNGELDAVTPPAYASHVATGFKNSRVVLLVNEAHDERNACIFGLIEAFVITGDGSKLDASCAANRPRIDFATGR